MASNQFTHKSDWSDALFVQVDFLMRSVFISNDFMVYFYMMNSFLLLPIHNILAALFGSEGHEHESQN